MSIVVSLALVGVAGMAGGATTAAAVGWMAGRVVRAQNQGDLPSLPSFVEAVDDVDEAVRAHAAVHDVVMTVTEAWNAAAARTLRRTSLEQALDRGALARRCEELHAAVDGLRAALDSVAALVVEARRSIHALEALWAYDRDHHYVTTMVPVTVSTGTTTTTTMQAQQVYSSTDHTFTWHPEALAPAGSALTRLRQAMSALPAPPMLGRARVDLSRLPEAERMLAERLVRQSAAHTDHALPDHRVTDAANQWLVGAGFDERVRTVFTHLRRAAQAGPQALRATEASPRRTERTTGRQHDPGPAGYQQVQAVRDDLTTATAAWAELERSLASAVDLADDVRAWADDPSVIESDRQYLRRATATYRLVFPSSQLAVAVPWHRGWAVAAAVVGGAVGGGVAAWLTGALALVWQLWA